MSERKTRSDKGTFQLKPRDVFVLTWIGEMYCVRFDILRILLSQDTDEEQRKRAILYHMQRQATNGDIAELEPPKLLAESTIYLILRRWKNAGLVESAQIVGGEPQYIWLTQKGIDSVGLPYRAHTPSLQLVKHTHAVTKVCLRMEEMHPQGTWKSERSITREINRLDPKERKRIDHVPDGEIHFSDGSVIVIEVELSQKAKSRISSIFAGLKHRYEMNQRKDVQIYYFVNEATGELINSMAFEPQHEGEKPRFTQQQFRALKLKEGYE